jgi:DNA-binding LacI/PurR family transcriptional regulator
MSQTEGRLTIKQVAAAAGVSPTTVSDIFNRKGRVDPATRERVLEVIDQLGWRPLNSARSLRTGRRGLIAVCLPRRPSTAGSPGLNSDYDMRLTMAAVTAAIERDQLLLIAPPLKSDAEVSRLEVDGVILVDPVRDDPSRHALERNGIPFVTVDRDLAKEDGWRVGIDNSAAVRNLLDHLVSRGASRVAFMTADSSSAWFADTRAAYDAWCSSQRIAPQISFIDRHAPEAAAAIAATELLAGRRPDAIVTDIYGAALGVLRAARDCQIAVPEDLLVASAVDGQALLAAEPAVTAVDLQPVDVGRAAVLLLAKRIAGKEPKGPVLVGEGHLRIRASTGGTSGD